MRPFFVAINGQKIKTKRQRGIVGNWETEKGGRTEEKRMRENKIRRKGRQKKQRRRNGDGRNRMR